MTLLREVALMGDTFFHLLGSQGCLAFVMIHRTPFPNRRYVGSEPFSEMQISCIDRVGRPEL